MAQLGIMSTTFERPTLDAVLEAVTSHGLHSVQFDLASAGLPSLPDRLDPAHCAEIRRTLDRHRVTAAALCGTFNMIDPDVEQRRLGLQRLQTMIAASSHLGSSLITLCTGTRNQQSMWRNHPDNGTDAAWQDLVVTMRAAVQSAEAAGVTLAFEPEVNNVVDSAQRARRLLDEIGSPHLRVIMDPANIFHHGELPRMAEMLDEAFTLLGPDIAMAHAKDLDHDGDAGHLPAGQGLLDYPRYLDLLAGSGFTGSIILHGLPETDVAGCVSFVWAAAPAALGLDGATS